MTTHADVAMTNASPIADVEQQSRRVSRWVSILYLVVALATPLLLYFGPDVLSPTAPAIANAALDGRFTVHRRMACDAPRPSNAQGSAAARC